MIYNLLYLKNVNTQATYACLKMVESPNPDTNQFTSWRRTSYKLLKFKPRNKQKKNSSKLVPLGEMAWTLCAKKSSPITGFSHQTIFDPKPQIKIDQNRISFWSNKFSLWSTFTVCELEIHGKITIFQCKSTELNGPFSIANC